MVDFLIHDPRRMSFLCPVDEDDGSALGYLEDVVLEYQDLTRTKGSRGRVGKANGVFRNRPGDRDICHHYHKHDEDHKDTECRDARLGQGSEKSEQDNDELGQERK